MQHISNLNLNGSSPSFIEISTNQQITNFNQSFHTSAPLPDEVWKLIFSDGNFKDLYNYSLVDKKFSQLTKDPLLLKQIIFNNFCFHPVLWSEFFSDEKDSKNDVEKAYEELSNHIHEIIRSDCPAFVDKKISKTHMLVWIPETINCKPVTLTNFAELFKKQSLVSSFQVSEVGLNDFIDKITYIPEADNPIKSGWVLMTLGTIQGTQNSRKYHDKKGLIDRLNINDETDYRVPKMGEALACYTAQVLHEIKYPEKPLLSPYLNYPVRDGFNSLSTICEENFVGDHFRISNFQFDPNFNKHTISCPFIQLEENYYGGSAALRRL